MSPQCHDPLAARMTPLAGPAEKRGQIEAGQAAVNASQRDLLAVLVFSVFTGTDFGLTLAQAVPLLRALLTGPPQLRRIPRLHLEDRGRRRHPIARQPITAICTCRRDHFRARHPPSTRSLNLETSTLLLSSPSPSQLRPLTSFSSRQDILDTQSTDRSTRAPVIFLDQFVGTAQSPMTVHH